MYVAFSPLVSNIYEWGNFEFGSTLIRHQNKHALNHWMLYLMDIPIFIRIKFRYPDIRDTVFLLKIHQKR